MVRPNSVHESPFTLLATRTAPPGLRIPPLPSVEAQSPPFRDLEHGSRGNSWTSVKGLNLTRMRDY